MADSGAASSSGGFSAGAQPTNGQLVQQGVSPYLYGAPGFSPMMSAGVEAFNRNTRPILEQQMQLQGLGKSPAVGVATADALAGILPQFISEDNANRFKAAGVLQGEEGLNQSAASLAANIANQEQMRQMQAYQYAGQMQLGMGGLYNQGWQNQIAQQQLALQAAGAGGELQRQIAQQALDSAQMERLRLQGLAEQASSGVFGNVIPPSGISNTSGRTSGGK